MIRPAAQTASDERFGRTWGVERVAEELAITARTVLNSHNDDALSSPDDNVEPLASGTQEWMGTIELGGKGKNTVVFYDGWPKWLPVFAISGLSTRTGVLSGSVSHHQKWFWQDNVGDW